MKICPKCKSKNIIPIIYGYPSNEMFEESNRGECILGGCCIETDEDMKNCLNRNHCNDCGYEW
ncbi:MAG: hypothetical protein ACI398_07825 [Clostridium sp.]